MLSGEVTSTYFFVSVSNHCGTCVPTSADSSVSATSTASTSASAFNALSLPYARLTPSLSAAACAVSACAVHTAYSSVSGTPFSAGTCALGPHLPAAPMSPTRNGLDCVIVFLFRDEFQFS